MTLRCVLDEGPDPKDDLNFVSWHPKGNVLLTGGKDNLIWLMNGTNGNYISCLGGHKDEVLSASFTECDQGKLIVSSSADKTIRVWSPRKAQQGNGGECLRVIKLSHQGSSWHDAAINCFALHHSQPLIVSGDLTGQVFCSNYQTG